MAITDILTKLDASSLVSGLLGEITAPLSDIEGTSSPVSDSALSDTAGISAQVDTSGIGQAVDRMAGQLPALLHSLPMADDVILPIMTAVELAEKVATNDLTSRIQSLLTRISGDFESRDNGGFLSRLEQFSSLLNSAPELKSLLELLAAAFKAGGIDFKPQESLSGLMPAFTGTMRGLGALMNLESTLSEGQRLMDIMARQVDQTLLTQSATGLQNRFAAMPVYLSNFIAHAGSATDQALAQTVQSVRSLGIEFADFEQLVTRSMGFGEATLVHFDIGRMETEVNNAIGALGATDIAVIGQGLQSLLDRIQPLLNINLQEKPAQGLDELLTELESKAGDIASDIAAVDISALVDPLQKGISSITGLITDFERIITQVTTAIQTALEQVRQVVAALPIDEIANAIQALMAPVSAAMSAIESLLGGIQSALETAANTVADALGMIESAVDTFKDTVDQLFKTAADFIESLHLDQVVGQVADGINAFADLLGKAQMKPYFDTANDVIGSAADIIEALPLSLLPDSIKSELDAAAAPVRAIDISGIKDEFDVEEMMSRLEGALNTSLADLQSKYDTLMDGITVADPRKYIDQINLELDKVKTKILSLLPQINLQPVSDAIARVKTSIGGFDLSEQLKPIEDAFATVTALIDDYDPTKLIAPVEERVNNAREAAMAAVRLDEWVPALDKLADTAKDLVSRIDPQQLEPAVVAALDEAKALLTQTGNSDLMSPVGNLVSSLLNGSGSRVQADTFKTVSGWLSGGNGAEALSARGSRISELVRATQASVQSIDIESLSIALTGHVEAMRSRILELPDGSDQRQQLGAAVDRLQVAAPLAALASNRARFLTGLTEAVQKADSLRRTGLSQVGVTIAGLQTACNPVTMLIDFFKSILAQVGITGFEGGMVGVMGRVLDVASAERLVGILKPILEAIRQRVASFIDTIPDPVKSGVEDLKDAVDAISLTPLRASLETIVEEVKDQITLLSPLKILEPTIASFESLQNAIIAFDPLAAVDTVLRRFETAINHIRDKLDAAELLAQPIRIYDDILAALEALRLDNLLAPVLDELETLAEQFEMGLDSTVESLERLQAALPAPQSGGGASASVSIG